MSSEIKNRGSEWRKWDLHVHAFKTHSNNNFGKDEGEYLDALNNSDVEAFGITDYFTAESQINTINKFREKFPNSTKVFFINVEFRLDKNVSNNPSGHVNLHLIFEPLLDEQKIKNFINSICIVQTNTNGTQKKISDLSTKNDFESATVTIDEITKKLKESFGSDKPYLIVLASGGLGGIRPATKDSSGKPIEGSKRNGTMSDELDKKADFFFGDEQSRKYYLDKKGNRYESSIPKATIKGSDAHFIFKHGKENGIGDKFSWIKADLTFEGLRQILFEPEERVSLLLDKPEEKSKYQIIDSIELDNNSSIFLNPNMNTIIGGRSTGKSTLTNSIAKKLKAPNFNEEEKNMHTFSKKEEDETIRINWADGEEKEDPEIEFLPQNYMIEIAESENKRNGLIEEIIKVKDGGKYNAAIEVYNSKVTENKNDLILALQSYFILEDQISKLIKPEGDKKGIEKAIEELIKKQKEKREQANFSEDESKLFDQKDEEFKKANLLKESIENNLLYLPSLKIEKVPLNASLSNLSANLKEKLEKELEKLEESAQRLWNRKIRKIIEEQNNLKIKTEETIFEIEQSNIYIKGKKNIANNDSLRRITENLKIERNKLEQFKKFELDREDLEKQTSQRQEDILTMYSNYKNYREELIDKFSVSAGKVEIKLDFSPVKYYGDILNHGSNKNNDFIESFNSDSDEKIKSIFDELGLTYNQRKTQNDLIEDLLGNIWYKYNFILRYENDNFDNMSQGKKAFVILSLILDFSEDKKPVIIDQPEDSLDNRAIFCDLTDYLKKSKKERQIILVTHNPNVVVGADAENIIVANQNSENTPNKNSVQFDYINGSLECIKPQNQGSKYYLPQKSIREHVFEVLEGGKDAFQKRENKYHLKDK